VLGTDEQGRDMLTRLMYGGRLSLLAGVVPVAIATVLGTIIGAVAWRSVDGVTWQRAADGPALGGAVMNAVTAGDGGFVAVGSDTGAVRSVGPHAASRRDADCLYRNAEALVTPAPG